LRVVADSFEIGGAGVVGAASFEWLEAGVLQVRGLGDYRLQITGTGERANRAAARLGGSRGRAQRSRAPLANAQDRRTGTFAAVFMDGADLEEHSR
jgi:hypothetical protein